jgi:hypothetical protein
MVALFERYAGSKMRLGVWLPSRHLRAVIVNITILLLVVLLLRAHAPLQELYAQIRKGMSRTEVVSILGKPIDLSHAERMIMVASMKSPAVSYYRFRRSADAAWISFELPTDNDSTFFIGQVDSLWIDSTHALMIHFADDVVQKYALVPVNIHQATFQEWCRYQWQRLLDSLGQ